MIRVSQGFTRQSGFRLARRVVAWILKTEMDTCPNCGADLPRRAKACPECGADEKTGWSEEAESRHLNLPEERFDYDQFLKRLSDVYDEEVEVRVNIYSAMKKLEDGKVDEALAEIETISKTAKPAQKQQLAVAKCKALIRIVSESGKLDDQAAKAMLEIAKSNDIDANTLNELSWSIYEAASADEKYSKPLIAAAVFAAEKAVAKDPENGPILDTLAHLVYTQGQLDRAIDLQSKAAKLAPAEMKDDLQAFLDELKNEKAKKKQ